MTAAAVQSLTGWASLGSGGSFNVRSAKQGIVGQSAVREKKEELPEQCSHQNLGQSCSSIVDSEEVRVDAANPPEINITRFRKALRGGQEKA